MEEMESKRIKQQLEELIAAISKFRDKATEFNEAKVSLNDYIVNAKQTNEEIANISSAAAKYLEAVKNFSEGTFFADIRKEIDKLTGLCSDFLREQNEQLNKINVLINESEKKHSEQLNKVYSLSQTYAEKMQDVERSIRQSKDELIRQNDAIGSSIINRIEISKSDVNANVARSIANINELKTLVYTSTDKLNEAVSGISVEFNEKFIHLKKAIIGIYIVLALLFISTIILLVMNFIK